MRRLIAAGMIGWSCLATIPTSAKEVSPVIAPAEADSEINSLLEHIEGILTQQENGTAAEINQGLLAAGSMYHYASAKGRDALSAFPSRLERDRVQDKPEQADNIDFFLQQAKPFIAKLTGKSEPTEQVAARPIPAPPEPKAPATSSKPDNDNPAKAMLARGDQMLALGDLIAARSFYERAAQMGLGAAALRMGDTYDAAFLLQHHLIGPEPDPGEADAWYKKAETMGTNRTTARLAVGD